VLTRPGQGGLARAAAALALSCAIWTEDTDFFGSGIAVWTSDRIEIFLKEQLKSLEADRT
jgi:hypothetical protein